MGEKQKAKRKLVILLLVYLSLAVVCIGLVFYQRFAGSGEEPLDLSEAVASGLEKEGQAVKVEFDALPVLMTPPSGNGDKLYFVTDVDNHVFIAGISGETFQSIGETLNVETGKLDSVYQLNGTLCTMDESVRNLAVSNSFKVFKNEEVTADTISDYVGGFYVKEKCVSSRTLTLYKISALAGVFFLILAFVYIVPAIIRVNKGEYGILDEKNMAQAFEKYLPDRETVTAGVHGVGLKTEIKQAFGKCRLDGEKLIPDKNAAGVEVSKCKYAKYDVYIGITQRYLILSECEKYKHYYEFHDIPASEGTAVGEIDACIPLADIGNCFPLTEIQKCVVEKAGMGAVNCSITMKNGSFLKLRLPKSGGPGMPNHAKYREAMIARLSVYHE